MDKKVRALMVIVLSMLTIPTHAEIVRAFIVRSCEKIRTCNSAYFRPIDYDSRYQFKRAVKIADQKEVFIFPNSWFLPNVEGFITDDTFFPNDSWLSYADSISIWMRGVPYIDYDSPDKVAQIIEVDADIEEIRNEQINRQHYFFSDWQRSLDFDDISDASIFIVKDMRLVNKQVRLHRIDVVQKVTDEEYSIRFINNTSDTLFLFSGYLDKRAKESVYRHQYDRIRKEFKLSFLPLLTNESMLKRNLDYNLSFLPLPPGEEIEIALSADQIRTRKYVEYKTSSKPHRLFCINKELYSNHYRTLEFAFYKDISSLDEFTYRQNPSVFFERIKDYELLEVSTYCYYLVSHKCLGVTTTRIKGHIH